MEELFRSEESFLHIDPQLRLLRAGATPIGKIVKKMRSPPIPPEKGLLRSRGHGPAFDD